MSIQFSPVNPFNSLYQAPLSKQKKTITLAAYEQFKKEFVFDKLKGVSFGEAFCKKFSIVDNMLSNIKSETEADFLIRSLGYIK